MFWGIHTTKPVKGESCPRQSWDSSTCAGWGPATGQLLPGQMSGPSFPRATEMLRGVCTAVRTTWTMLQWGLRCVQPFLEVRGYGRSRNKNSKKWEENSSVEVRTLGEPASCRSSFGEDAGGWRAPYPTQLSCPQAGRALGRSRLHGCQGCLSSLSSCSRSWASHREFSPPPLEWQGSGGRLRGHQQSIGSVGVDLLLGGSGGSGAVSEWSPGGT